MKTIIKKTLLTLFVMCVGIINAQNSYQLGAIVNATEKVNYANLPSKPKSVAYTTVVEELESYSLKNYLPTVSSQGIYGTCVGWSSSYYGRTILEAKKRNLTSTDDINAIAFSPVYTYYYSKVDGDVNCKQGAFIYKAMENLKNKGVPYKSDYDYMCANSAPSYNIDTKAEENKIKEYAKLFDFGEGKDVKVTNTRRSLANGYPVIIAFKVYNSFFGQDGADLYQRPTGDTYDPFKGYHAMCVIGYDDNKFNGAFQLVNSWGQDFGNNGFIWVKYDDFAELTDHAYEMIPELKTIDDKNELAAELNFKLYNSSASMSCSSSFSKALGYQKVVSEENQSIANYQTSETYPAGTKYKIITKVNKPCYVYLFSSDSDGRTDKLFPYKEGTDPYISYPGTEVYLPGKSSWMQLNGDVTSDYTIAIFSNTELNLDDIVNKVNTDYDGTIYDKLYRVFGNKLIPKEDMNFSSEKIAFNADFNKGSIAAVVIDIKRK